MRRLLYFAAIAIMPGGIPIAVAVWVARRMLERNRVVVVPAPATLTVVKGGRA